MTKLNVKLAHEIDAEKLRKCWIDRNAPIEGYSNECMTMCEYFYAGCTSSSLLMHEPFRCFALRDVITVEDMCRREATEKLTTLIDEEIEVRLGIDAVRLAMLLVVDEH